VTSKKSREDSQASGTNTGAAQARQKATERLGEWIKGKWRLETLLGVGGMATVYAARHRNASRAALKILHAEYSREEAIRTRFLREGYVANTVEHPGVVRILDDDVTDLGEPFLIMELLEGETLRQLWKRRKRKVPVVEVLKIAEAVLDTLVPCHEKNIIHRDLKPANIFICTDGTIKLLDFGVAQMREAGTEALTRAGTALGTPSFMSPEQAQGHSENLDPRADIFSVGATLYATLSGKRLLHDRRASEAFILAATQPAPSLARVAPHLPVEVIALVDRALQWDRRKRFRSAAAMRDTCRELIWKLGGADGLTAMSSSAGEAAAAEPKASNPALGHERGGPASVPPTSNPPDLRTRTTAPPGGSSAAARRQIKPPPFTPLPDLATDVDVKLAGQSSADEFYAPRGPSWDRGSEPPTTPERPAAMGGQRAVSDRPPPPSSMPASLSGSLAPTSGVPRAPDSDEEGGHPLSTLFERFEKALPTLRQYGLEHPEGQAKTRAIHRAFCDTLGEVGGNIHFQVHPFCFTEGGVTVWEPGAPHDQVPYGLAASGVEDVRISAGVSEAEVRDFLRITVIEPQLGLSDGDIGAALWEAGFAHIHCTVRDDLADADAREQIRFFSESKEVEVDARKDLAELVHMLAQTARPSMMKEDAVEAAAMAFGADKEMFEAARAASESLTLDKSSSIALRNQLTLDPEEWRERFYDVTPLALADAAEREDVGILYRELEHHVQRYVAAGRWREVLEVHETLIKRLARGGGANGLAVEITRQIFTWPRLKTAFAFLREGTAGESLRDDLRAAVTRVLPEVRGDMLNDFMMLANELGEGELFEMAMRYVEAHGRGREGDILALLDSLRPELAQRMLAAVVADRSKDHDELLRPLLSSANPALRCEAMALLARSPDELGKQLVRMLQSGDARQRSAALTTMVRYRVRQAGPGLVAVIEDEASRLFTDAELHHMFETLYALNPPRAESLLTAIVSAHGLMSDEALDRKRAVAADALGRHADSENPIEALQNAARLRPWNTQVVRTAAGAAVESIRSRLQTRGMAGGKS
jgi:serine/threonine protein kinase